MYLQYCQPLHLARLFTAGICLLLSGPEICGNLLGGNLGGGGRGEGEGGGERLCIKKKFSAITNWPHSRRRL